MSTWVDRGNKSLLIRLGFGMFAKKYTARCSGYVKCMFLQEVLLYMFKQHRYNSIHNYVLIKPLKCNYLVYLLTESASLLPALTPAQCTKLKHLTIVSLAAKYRVRTSGPEYPFLSVAGNQLRTMKYLT